MIIPLSWNSVNAQILDFPEKDKKSVEQENKTGDKKNAPSSPIENNVKVNLFVIEQNYRLKDITKKSKNVFGRKDNKFFGSVYTIGLRSVKGFYTDSKAVTPWLFDPNFDEYKGKMQYQPFIVETNWRNIEDTKYTKSKKLIIDPQTIHVDNILFSTDMRFGKYGLTTNTSLEEQEGWIVWVIKDDRQQDAFATVIQSAKLKFDEFSKTTSAESAKAPKNVVFGVFVIEQNDSRGQIITVISGVAVNKDGNWSFRKPDISVSERHARR
jgi:hypothetical protein